MGRWEPNAEGRMLEAALDLFTARGYEQTTVADIAQRARVTQRTFFRYFTDKREVLFGGEALLERAVTTALAGSPAPAAPIDGSAVPLASGDLGRFSAFDAMVAAIAAAGATLEPRRDFARRRAAVIAANPSLQERELLKLASLAAAAAAALQVRGTPGPEAVLVAEVGMTLFRVAFDQWVGDPAAQPFADVAHAVAQHLRAATVS
jgi:AcrR family transcriptional regulator